MRKIILSGLMILIVALFVVGCQSNVQTEEPVQTPVQKVVETPPVFEETKGVEKVGETKQVVVKDFKFNPNTVEVNVGDSVEWVNNEAGVPHTVTFDDNSYNEKLPVGASVTRTFNEKGTFTYHCALHPNMQATVIVN